MIIFNGKYNWDGKKRDDRFPVIWWPGSYRLTIVDLQDTAPGTILLKPYLCLFSGIESKYSIKTKFERFAVKIADEFNLDPEKILWIEGIPDEVTAEMEVAMLETVTRMKDQTLYKTVWRNILPNELKMIRECNMT